MRLAVIVCFLNEEAHLPALLDSLAIQQREPERLLLVDDGSSDASPALASAFASVHPYARVLSRPRRPAQPDRLATAAELEAFCWAVEQLEEPWDVVAKLDADLRLTPRTFAELVSRFDADPRLGIAGAYHSIIGPDGQPIRERCPPGHVHGSSKFYRRDCFVDVFPLPVRLGWDTSDEITARMHGWRTESFAMPDGEPIHLRPIATHDGMLRGYRRSGMSAYGYGARAWWVLLGTAGRLRSRPMMVGGLNYLLGWLVAAVRRDPRADARQRSFLAREHRARLLSTVSRRLPH
jgi:glycosyltransferase involved in cell wall biosynthesis